MLTQLTSSRVVGEYTHAVIDTVQVVKQFLCASFCCGRLAVDPVVADIQLLLQG